MQSMLQSQTLVDWRGCEATIIKGMIAPTNV